MTTAVKNEVQVTPIKINKSAQIRALFKDGKTTAEIAKIVGIRYQFAYNVLHRPLKRLSA